MVLCFYCENCLLWPLEGLSNDMKKKISTEMFSYNMLITLLSLCFVSCRIFSITSQMFRALEESGSQRLGVMMHGRCTLMRQPKKLWMNLPCAMASSPYIRP